MYLTSMAFHPIDNQNTRRQGNTVIHAHNYPFQTIRPYSRVPTASLNKHLPTGNPMVHIKVNDKATRILSLMLI